MFCRMLARVTRMPYSDDSNRCRQGRPTGTLTVPRSPPSRPSPAAAGWDTKLHRSLARGFVRLCRPLLRDVLGPVAACPPVLAFFPRPGLSVCRPFSRCGSVQTERETGRQPRQTASLFLSPSLALRPPLASSSLLSLFAFLSFLSAEFFSLFSFIQATKAKKGERRVARAR